MKNLTSTDLAAILKAVRESLLPNNFDGRGAVREVALQIASKLQSIDARRFMEKAGYWENRS